MSDGLSLTRLRLSNFRNYSSLDLPDIGTLNLLIGPNAVGKTSIIEAIQLMTAQKSFRTSHAEQLVAWGQRNASVIANIEGERSLEEKLSIDEGKRSYSLNGKNKRIQDLKGLLPSVTFSPDDLTLVKGSNTNRLTSIDDLGTQLSKTFYAVRKDYGKLLRQKNRALKDGLDPAFVDSLNEVLVKVGVQYLSHRLTVINKVVPLIQEYYRQICNTDSVLDLAFIPSWDKEREQELIDTGSYQELRFFDKETFIKRYEQELSRLCDQERIRERALVGPHADHLLFIHNGHSAIHFASQGEQRSIVLAYKLAESTVIQEILSQKPILLLDDVMSELDEHRRRYFMEFITDDIQTFITTTNSSYFDDTLLDNAMVYNLPFEDTL